MTYWARVMVTSTNALNAAARIYGAEKESGDA